MIYSKTVNVEVFGITTCPAPSPHLMFFKLFGPCLHTPFLRFTTLYLVGKRAPSVSRLMSDALLSMFVWYLILVLCVRIDFLSYVWFLVLSIQCLAHSRAKRGYWLYDTTTVMELLSFYIFLLWKIITICTLLYHNHDTDLFCLIFLPFFAVSRLFSSPRVDIH